jgi:cytochrome oxidase assembly protein ShyY1
MLLLKTNNKKFLVLFPMLSASLCLWQVKRYYEKKELIRNINEAYYNCNNSSNNGKDTEITSLEQLKELEYHRVTIQNGKHRVKESFMVGPKVKKGYGLGYYVHDSIRLNDKDDEEEVVVVVNRGFVPEGRMQEFYNNNSSNNQDTTPMMIRGVVYNQKYFMPSRMFRQTHDSDTDTDTCFIHVDTRRMGSQSEYFIMEIGGGGGGDDNSSSSSSSKIPIRSDDGVMNVPNKHLEYIATWGLLTAALLGMIFK